ncbi:hypothetical protein [Variovorax sp. dw_954]|uniref:hypothetical protein n=1 Tax=Variovorax sp. dw_954 TaxID=2720078 RepID=UPI001BD600F5|nr:hypothetical protein [Variovorax sp. dw_954]
MFPVDSKEAALASLLERRSISPKRLGAPGPDVENLNLMLKAALIAPDHGVVSPRARK